MREVLPKKKKRLRAGFSSGVIKSTPALINVSPGQEQDQRQHHWVGPAGLKLQALIKKCVSATRSEGCGFKTSFLCGARFQSFHSLWV